MPPFLACCSVAWLLIVPPPPKDKLSESEKVDIAFSMNVLVDLASRITQEYSGRGNDGKRQGAVQQSDLLLAAVEQIYAVAEKPFPDQVRKDLGASGGLQAVTLLTQARIQLGVVPELAGLKTFFRMVQGFNKVLDPYCALTWASGNSFASSDCEFGLGFELEGVSGWPYQQFLLETQRKVWQGVDVKPETLTPPIGARWTISRVIPGSPAAKAGLRPGDRITHLNGDEVTPAKQGPLFLALAVPSFTVAQDSERNAERSKVLKLQIERPGRSSWTVSVPREAYQPQSLFGMQQTTDGDWSYWLDAKQKLAYVRVGSVESAAGGAFQEILQKLEREGMRGLVLDLRWCPGGYVTPTAQIAGAFLPEQKMISRIQGRPDNRGSPSEYASSGGQFLNLPLVVLVNGQTTGGGEMIAAALQDYERATIVGQRTFGKANIMTSITTSFPGLQYRVSNGYSLRPSGKNRHRFVGNTLADDWGVRPDKGWAIPMTPDLAQKLRLLAEQQAIRPHWDREAVLWDDPWNDPQRFLALKALKEKLPK